MTQFNLSLQRVNSSNEVKLIKGTWKDGEIMEFYKLGVWGGILGNYTLNKELTEKEIYTLAEAMLPHYGRTTKYYQWFSPAINMWRIVLGN